MKRIIVGIIIISALCAAALMLSLCKSSTDSKGPECTLSAFFVLQGKDYDLCANEFGLLALTIKNNTKSDFYLNSLNPRGVEQLSEIPRPAKRKNVVPCYTIRFLIEFLDEERNIVHQDSSFLPFSGHLYSGKEVICLVRVKVPDISGKYSVKISGFESAKRGSFGIPKKDPEWERLKKPEFSKFSANIDEVFIALHSEVGGD